MNIIQNLHLNFKIHNWYFADCFNNFITLVTLLNVHTIILQCTCSDEPLVYLANGCLAKKISTYIILYPVHFLPVIAKRIKM